MSKRQQQATRLNPLSSVDEFSHLEGRIASGSIDAQVIVRLSELINYEEPSAQAYYLMGRACDRLGYHQLSPVQYKAADQLNPQLASQILLAFRSRVQDSDVAGAKMLFHYILSRFPEDPSVLVMNGLQAKQGSRWAANTKRILTKVAHAVRITIGTTFELENIQRRSKRIVTR